MPSSDSPAANGTTTAMIAVAAHSAAITDGLRELDRLQRPGPSSGARAGRSRSFPDSASRGLRASRATL